MINGSTPGNPGKKNIDDSDIKSRKIDWRIGSKRYLKTRLIITGFIFALVGWFLLVVMLFEQFLEDELLQIEKFLKTQGFVWGLRAFVLLVLVILIRKNEWLGRLLQNRIFKVTFYSFCGIGAIGWIWGLLNLL